MLVLVVVHKNNMKKLKDNYGIKVGDKVRFKCEHEETGHIMTVAGIVTEIDHEDYRSDEYPTFHVQRKNGDSFWYFGPNLIKRS